MGNITYQSYRIFKQNGLKFYQKEFESIKSFIFNSPLYHVKKEFFQSRRTPIIFELTLDDYCIEVQHDTYSRDYLTAEILEMLYKQCYPYYEFWFINCHEAIDRDSIYCHKYILKDAPWEDPKLFYDGGICEYMYDSIVIETKDEIPNGLSYINWIRSDSEFKSRGLNGKYHSNSLKGGTNEIISLSDKYDLKRGGIGNIYVVEEWYSDSKFKYFLDTEFMESTISKIKFFFNGRIVRELFKSREMLCYDGWDNCANDIFLSYMNKRQ